MHYHKAQLQILTSRGISISSWNTTSFLCKEKRYGKKVCCMNKCFNVFEYHFNEQMNGTNNKTLYSRRNRTDLETMK